MKLPIASTRSDEVQTGTMTSSMRVRLSPEQRAAVEAAAKAENRTIASLIRHAVAFYLESKQGQGS